MGIHWVRFSGDAYSSMSLDATSEAHTRVVKPMEEYLNAMEVPRKYANIMLRTSSKDIYVPTFPEAQADFYGWVPDIEEWLIGRCGTKSDRQMETEERAAIVANRLGEFLDEKLRGEACIQDAMLRERLERIKRY